MPGVAIVGRSTWAVFSARKKLQLEWDNTETANESWSGFQRQARKLSAEKGETLTAKGDVDKAFAQADKTLEGFYSYPFVAHAPMEPQNCHRLVFERTLRTVGTNPKPATGSFHRGKTAGH